MRAPLPLGFQLFVGLGVVFSLKLIYFSCFNFWAVFGGFAQPQRAECGQFLRDLVIISFLFSSGN